MSQLRVNEIVSEDGTGQPSFPLGVDFPSATVGDLQVTGVTTTTGVIDANGGIDVDGDITATGDLTVNNIVGAAATFAGDIQVQGTVTYEDVSSIDSVGVITAQSGIRVGAGESIGSTGSTEDVLYYGDGSNLTNLPSGKPIAMAIVFG